MHAWRFEMIKQGKYILRRGKPGDRGVPGYFSIPRDQPQRPEFVLEYEGVQIGATHGSICCIRHIEIFEDIADHNIGHGTKFVELWEAYTKARCKRLKVSPVTVPNLAHILSHKRGFELTHDDGKGAQTYEKNC